MSYDLMVFERTSAPQKYKDFLEWYEKETEWEEEHDYNDPSVTSSALKSWYEEITETFPNLNGPDALNDEMNNDKEAHLTDYSIGYHVIYAAFAWSVSDEAYELTKALAQKHNVGFFDASGEGSVILPDGSLME